MNTDASFFKDHNRVGFGCVVRDSSGMLVLSRSLPLMGLPTPKEVEIMSIE